MVLCLQTKKRKHERENERSVEEQEDPLKDATTLYVGNLYVLTVILDFQIMDEAG